MTTQNKMIYYETYNLKKVAYLHSILNERAPKIYDKCKNQEEIMTETKKLETFLEYIIINDGTIEVEYDTSTIYRWCGRPFTIQSISGKVRNFLLEDEPLVDIDIENSICACLIPFCLKYYLKCATMKYYYEERQCIIDEYYNGSKEKCKEFINIAFFNDTQKTVTHNEFEENLLKDIKILQDFVYHANDDPIFSTIRNDAEISQTKKHKTNYKGATLSKLYHHIECGILKEALQYYSESNSNKQIKTLMFDGFIADKPDDDFDIEALNEHISTLLRSHVKFVYKEIKGDSSDIPPIPQDFQYNLNAIKGHYYMKLFKTKHLNIFNRNDDELYAEIMYLLYGDNFVFINKKKALYLYYKNKWIVNNYSLCKHYIYNQLKAIMDVVIVYLSHDIQACNGEKKEAKENRLKKLLQLTACINQSAKPSSILEFLKCKLSGRVDNIEFDNTLLYVICFNNKAIDVRNGEEIIIKKTDYITFSTGYNYVKPSTQDMKLMHEIWTSIFQNEEIRKTYLSILWSGLTAIRQEKFFMANGCGRNGKGLLNELMVKTLGQDYAYNGNIETLTKPLKSGANPELAQLNKKRFVKFEEPNDHDVLQLGNIKKLTGEGIINARESYSNNTQQILQLTMVIELNKRINANGRIDESVIERFVDIHFQSYFTNDKEELEKNPNAKPKNEAFKNQEFQDNMRCVLFDYLIEHARQELYVADCVKERTREYLMDNDDLLCWFQENYIKDVEGIPIKVKDVFEHYKESSQYQNLTKQARRKLSEKNFKILIETNVELRKYYVERKQIGNKQHKSIIIGWKVKDDCDDI